MNQLIVNSIFMNPNKTLISLATNKGFRILEKKTYKIINDIYEILDFIGSIKIAIPYFESRLVVFVGSDDNFCFPPTQVIIWDDIFRRPFGMVIVSHEILQIKITKYHLFVVIQEKILIIDFLTLTTIITINDVNHNMKSITFGLDQTQYYIGFQSLAQNSRIELYKILLYDTHKIKGKSKLDIMIGEDGSQYLKISQTREFLFNVTKSGQHIICYSLIEGKIINIIERSIKFSKIINISFSNNDYFMCVVNFGKSLNLHLFSLNQFKHNKKESEIQLDKGEFYNENEVFENQPLWLVHKVQKLFQPNQTFSWYEYNYDEDFHSETEEKYPKIGEFHKFLVYFDKINEIVIFDGIGKLDKIRYDIREGGPCWNDKVTSWI